MRLKQDAECRELRQISDERRLSFARGLKVGDVIGVWAGGEGDVDHTFFWLAQVQRRSIVNAMDGDSPVPFKADKTDKGWDITRGEWILNIRWLKRLRAKVFETAGEQAIALTSVLPVKVVWAKTSTNQFTLSNSQHEELLHLCACVKELDPRYKLKT